MAEIKYVSGDATWPIGSGKKIIIHACNDAGGWTKGFVESISKNWPEPEKEYRSWVRKREDFQLGRIQVVEVAPNITVINMLCQRGINFERNLDQKALEKCLNAIIEHYSNSEEKSPIHMPRICKGLMGANWYLIENILKKTLVVAGFNVFVYDWVK